MKQKTPQEKKALSYEKDCRNTYGENDKSSRKNIPLRKAKANRSDRKKLNDVLHKVKKVKDIEVIESFENEVLSVKRNQWKKYPDKPLGQVIERQIERRELHARNGKTARKKMKEFIANLNIETKRKDRKLWIATTNEPQKVQVEGETEEIAIEKCKRLAGYYFLEHIGSAGMITVDGNSISVVTY
jgi:hypothetical protein